MTITEADKLGFAEHLREAEREESTVKLYLSAVEQFAAFMAGRPLTKEGVLAYKAWLLRTYAASTANGKLGTVNLFLRYLGAPELCLRRLRIQRQFYLPEDRILSYGDYVRLVALARQEGDEKLALCMEILCATGIRVSELPFITPEAARRGMATVRNKGKTRTVLLPRALCRRISDYAAGAGILRGPVILSRSGQPLDRTRIWRQMHRLCARAGIPPEKGHPHALRHLFAVTYYRVSRDPMGLADLLGHASLDTTRIYTAVPPAALTQRLEQMDLVL